MSPRARGSAEALGDGAGVGVVVAIGGSGESSPAAPKANGVATARTATIDPAAIRLLRRRTLRLSPSRRTCAGSSGSPARPVVPRCFSWFRGSDMGGSRIGGVDGGQQHGEGGASTGQAGFDGSFGDAQLGGDGGDRQ